MNKVTCIKNKDYSTISNVFFKDKNLSLKAKGLLAMVLTLPDNWDFTINGIEAITKEGKTAIYSAIDELKEHGYCKVTSVRDEKGAFKGNDYTFIENPYMENPNMDNKPQLNTNLIKDISSIEYNQEEINKKEYKEKSNKLFEECWIAYKRKGKKGKAKQYWDKLSQIEKENVLAHIKPYVSSRELQYQQDFERYLRDKTFLSVVISKNNIVYDPTKLGKGESTSNVYVPSGNFAITWDDNLKAYLYIGFYSDGMMMPDGYDNDNRPDGAKLVLNNGRGTITWNKTTKTWNRV